MPSINQNDSSKLLNASLDSKQCISNSSSNIIFSSTTSTDALSIIDQDFSSQEERKWSLSQSHKTMLAGGIAGSISKSIMAPLSRITILLQVGSAVKSAASSSVSQSKSYTPNQLTLTQTFLRIINNEGIFAFWKGNFTSVLHRFPYSAINFSVFEISRKYAKERLGFQESAFLRLLCGGIGGATACFACYPLDLIRTRLTVDINPAIVTKPVHNKHFIPNLGSHSIINIYNDIVHVEGIFGLYRGLGISLLVCVPNLAIGFATYGAAKEVLLRKQNTLFTYNTISNNSNQRIHELNMLGAMICGASSGILSSLLVYPADVIRRRLQVRGMFTSLSGNVKIGVMSEIKELWKNEGFRGFYRGLLPEILKVTPAVGITFCMYELALRLLP